MTTKADASLPIGVFDSGVGGLTVLRAIRTALPDEDIIYLGDTARLPYGTKSPASIVRYAAQATAALIEQRIKLLVIACNTATAVAQVELARSLSPLPVIGVVGPGAAAAVAAKPGGSHLVLATEATVRLGAYRRALQALDAAAQVHEHACELLVALAEEGWTSGQAASAIVERYVREARADGFTADTIILGCTHFPILRDLIKSVVDDDIVLIDSASTTTAAVVEALRAADACNSQGGQLRFLATDGVTRFVRVGGQFLGEPLTADDVQLIDL